MKKTTILITALFLSQPLPSLAMIEPTQITPAISATTEVELRVVFPDEIQEGSFYASIYDDAGQSHNITFKASKRMNERTVRITSVSNTDDGESLIDADELPSFTFSDHGDILSMGDIDKMGDPANFTLTFDFSATGGSASQVVTFKCGTIGQRDGFAVVQRAPHVTILGMQINGGPAFGPSKITTPFPIIELAE